MTNPAMPGLLKVGMSERAPHVRAREISSHEGLPFEMQLEYYALVKGHPRTVEFESHRLLADSHVRKEWFSCDCLNAILAIRQAANDKLQFEQFLKEDRDKADAKDRERILQQERDRKIRETENRKRESGKIAFEEFIQELIQEF